MTHTKDEAFVLALEALTRYVSEDEICEGMPGNEPWVETKYMGEAAITAIKQALAAPTVQEPALVIYQGEIAKSNLPKGFTGMLYTTPPAAPVQEPDDDLTQALIERDEYHSIADQLAEVIAQITGADIGEHTSSNFPWYNALDAAKEWIATPPAAQPATVPLTLWTEAQHERAYRNSPELHKDVKSLEAFKRVAKEVAAMYGITKGQP
jgi:hypothetical protein